MGVRDAINKDATIHNILIWMRHHRRMLMVTWGGGHVVTSFLCTESGAQLVLSLDRVFAKRFMGRVTIKSAFARVGTSCTAHGVSTSS